VTDTTNPRRSSGQSAAERMRAYRRRRQEQTRSIRIVCTPSEIDAFVKRGYLHPDSRNDIRAIGYAATAFISARSDGPCWVVEVRNALGPAMQRCDLIARISP